MLHHQKSKRAKRPIADTAFDAEKILNSIMRNHFVANAIKLGLNLRIQTIRKRSVTVVVRKIILRLINHYVISVTRKVICL